MKRITNLADGAEPAEVMDEPIRQWATGQVVLAPQLAAVRVRVDAPTGRELLDHVPHHRGRDARRVAVVQMLRHSPEREAGAEHGEHAVRHVGQASKQPRRPVVARRGTAAAAAVAVVVDDGRRLRPHDGVRLMLDGAIRLLPCFLSHERLRRLLRSRPHRRKPAPRNSNPNSRSTNLLPHTHPRVFSPLSTMRENSASHQLEISRKTDTHGNSSNFTNKSRQQLSSSIG